MHSAQNASICVWPGSGREVGSVRCMHPLGRGTARLLVTQRDSDVLSFIALLAGAYMKWTH